MKLIESKAELLLQPDGLEGVYKQIEICGRTCYKSTDKITDESAKPFVERMIASKHTAMLEQGTVYLIIKWWHIIKFFKYLFNPYSKVHRYRYVTTNLRVITEKKWDNDLEYICEPTKYHEKRYTMKFTTDRGVMAELTRHRVFSFSIESTRYCNYLKDKFGNELTFILPTWLVSKLNLGHYEIVTPDNKDGEIIGDGYIKNVYDYSAENIFVKECLRSELQYINLINLQYSPQQARQILPNALKTEVCMTGFASDWRFLLDLRCFGKTGAPHPDMLNLMEKAQKAMQEADIWEDIMKYKSKFE